MYYKMLLHVTRRVQFVALTQFVHVIALIHRFHFQPSIMHCSRLHFGSQFPSECFRNTLKRSIKCESILNSSPRPHVTAASLSVLCQICFHGYFHPYIYLSKSERYLCC